MSPEARRKLLILAARSEEALIETHVANVLQLLHTLGEEIDLDRGFELYQEIMTLPAPLAGTVRTRVFARWDARAVESTRLQEGAAVQSKPRARSRHLEV